MLGENALISSSAIGDLASKHCSPCPCAVCSRGSSARPSHALGPRPVSAWFLVACQGGICTPISTKAPRPTGPRRNQLLSIPLTLPLKGGWCLRHLRQQQHGCSYVDKDFHFLMDLYNNLSHRRMSTASWKLEMSTKPNNIGTIKICFIKCWFKAKNEHYVI